MKRIQAIVRREKLDEVRTALEEVGYPGMTLSEVKGHGRQKGMTEQFRGREYKVDLLSKIEIEIVAKDEAVEEIIDAIVQNAKTGEVGDGKIFVSPIEKAIRIRTGEEGEEAL